MWKVINVKGSFDAVILSIVESRAIWCTDGSFDRVVLPDVSSAGWIIFDPDTKSWLEGSFYEVSGDASAYRGELLGLAALHLIAAAVTELHGVPSSHRTSCTVIMKELFTKRSTYFEECHQVRSMEI